MEDKIKIVCLGDSITYGFPFGPQASWVRMLSEVMEAEIINKGINGNMTWDMLNRFERAVIKNNPTHVIIMGGINDVICGESFDRIVWNIRSMVEQAQSAGIKVILGIPTGVDDIYWEKLLVRIRSWIIEYANKMQIKTIDFSKAFFNANGQLKKELLLADGGHPTMAGYEAMFEQIDLGVFE